MRRREAVGIIAGAASAQAAGAFAPAACSSSLRFGQLSWLRVAAERNSVISTLSVFEGVAVLASGAAPETQKKLVEALELEPRTLDALLDYLKKPDAGARSLSSASVLSVSSPGAVSARQRRELLDDLNCRVVDDRHHMDEVLAQISGPADAAWLAQNRAAVESAQFGVVNATELASPWTFPFDRRDTFHGTFSTGGGKRLATYMRRSGAFRVEHLRSDLTVILPFRNGLSMALLLPRSIKRLAAGWEYEAAQEIKAGAVPASEVELVLPRFAFKSVVRFGSALSHAAALSHDDKIFGYPAARLSATQLAHVRVDENGASLSAVTIIAKPKRKRKLETIAFDRPFGFAVIDANAVVLFKGSVFEPQ